jgi:hypothetical protein
MEASAADAVNLLTGILGFFFKDLLQMVYVLRNFCGKSFPNSWAYGLHDPTSGMYLKEV